MPTFMLRDVDRDFLTRFTDKAKADGWPPSALALRLLEDYLAGRIAPSGQPPPRRSPA